MLRCPSLLQSGPASRLPCWRTVAYVNYPSCSKAGTAHTNMPPAGPPAPTLELEMQAGACWGGDTRVHVCVIVLIGLQGSRLGDALQPVLCMLWEPSLGPAGCLPTAPCSTATSLPTYFTPCPTFCQRQCQLSSPLGGSESWPQRGSRKRK